MLQHYIQRVVAWTNIPFLTFLVLQYFPLSIQSIHFRVLICSKSLSFISFFSVKTCFFQQFPASVTFKAQETKQHEAKCLPE